MILRVLYCTECKQFFYRKQQNYRPNRKYFCSLRCSSKHHIKRQYPEEKRILNKPLKEVLYGNQKKTKGKNKYAIVRNQAKKLYLTESSSCAHCGFKQYVEVCHIKPINSFQEETLVSAINSPENILLLCPRCHWEFDSSYFKFEDLGKPLFNFKICPPIQYINYQNNKMVEDLFLIKSGPTNRYTKIRQEAKRRIKNLRQLSCQYCHYASHIEVCHIKSIGNFPKDSIISEINAAENLIILCPNCHWCFDHGILGLEKIKEVIGKGGLEPPTCSL